jgi:predicted NBD/HSP70 family sugar kinase
MPIPFVRHLTIDLGEASVDRRSWLPEDLRAYHRGLLLRLLGEEGPMTRRDLAHGSGLSIPTAASIVSELLTSGYITESVPAHSRGAPRGPRANLLVLARHAHVVLGVDVGAGQVRIGLCDLSGVVSEVVSVPVRRGTQATELLAAAVGAATPLIRTAGKRLLGIGVCVPGPVDPAGRRNLLSLALGWRDVPVAERFEEAFSTPVVAEYNVRAMALAEARHGLGLRAENLLYVHLGDGLGFAFVVDGRPFRQGAHGVCELAHHRVVERGPRCSCGATGCLEAVLGEPYLRQRIRDAAGSSSVLAPLVRRRMPVLELLDLAVQSGDRCAAAILDDVVDHLSTAIALSVNVFSPTRVALGGELASAPKEVLGRVQAASHAKVSRLLNDQVRIERSEIGRYPGVLGAGTVALDRLFYRDQSPTTAVRGSRRPRPAWAAAAATATGNGNGTREAPARR